MNVARAHGLVIPGQDSTKAVRAVLAFDARGSIRTIIAHPLSLSRNFDELLPVVSAVQRAATPAATTPADWGTGEPVIVPASGPSASPRTGWPARRA